MAIFPSSSKHLKKVHISTKNYMLIFFGHGNDTSCFDDPKNNKAVLSLFPNFSLLLTPFSDILVKVAKT